MSIHFEEEIGVPLQPWRKCNLLEVNILNDIHCHSLHKNIKD